MAAEEQQHLTEEQLNDYKQAFDMFDKNKDNTIDMKELAIVLRSLGQNPTQAELEQMVHSVQHGDDDVTRINFEEFVQLLTNRPPPPDQSQEIAEAFKNFDKDGNGYISAAELRHAMTAIGERMTESEVAEMIAEADIDGDGLINYNEFVKMLVGK